MHSQRLSMGRHTTDTATEMNQAGFERSPIQHLHVT